MKNLSTKVVRTAGWVMFIGGCSKCGASVVYPLLFGEDIEFLSVLAIVLLVGFGWLLKDATLEVR